MKLLPFVDVSTLDCHKRSILELRASVTVVYPGARRHFPQAVSIHLAPVEKMPLKFVFLWCPFQGWRPEPVDECALLSLYHRFCCRIKSVPYGI